MLLGMPPTETIYLRVPPGLKRDLERWAAIRGASVNELAIAYLAAMVEQMERALAESVSAA